MGIVLVVVVGGFVSGGPFGGGEVGSVMYAGGLAPMGGGFVSAELFGGGEVGSDMSAGGFAPMGGGFVEVGSGGGGGGLKGRVWKPDVPPSAAFICGDTSSNAPMGGS